MKPQKVLPRDTEPDRRSVDANDPVGRPPDPLPVVILPTTKRPTRKSVSDRVADMWRVYR